MENLIKCPKCNGSDKGCSYCAYVGYIFNEAGKHYFVTLDSKDNPIKGGAIEVRTNEKSNGLTDPLFPTNEPHDMLWFFKDKL